MLKVLKKTILRRDYQVSMLFPPPLPPSQPRAAQSTRAAAVAAISGIAHSCRLDRRLAPNPPSSDSRASSPSSLRHRPRRPMPLPAENTTQPPPRRERTGSPPTLTSYAPASTTGGPHPGTYMTIQHAHIRALGVEGFTVVPKKKKKQGKQRVVFSFFLGLTKKHTGDEREMSGRRMDVIYGRVWRRL